MRPESVPQYLVYLERDEHRRAEFRPLTFFMLENLLEARAESRFPTNSRGPDDDVNVYIGHLLTSLVSCATTSTLSPGNEPLLNPPAKVTASRRIRAEFYRHNADHRLLCLGLFRRGDLLRRRAVPYGRTDEEARALDLDVGVESYALAANLLEGRRIATSVLAPILRKLSRHFADYSHVIEVLARRRFGLGKRLSPSTLRRLIDPAQAEPTPSEFSPPTGPEMDRLLDLLSAYRRTPSLKNRRRVIETAHRLGIDPGAIFEVGEDATG